MGWPENPLHLNPEQTQSEIADLIQNKFNHLNLPIEYEPKKQTRIFCQD